MAPVINICEKVCRTFRLVSQEICQSLPDLASPKCFWSSKNKISSIFRRTFALEIFVFFTPLSPFFTMPFGKGFSPIFQCFLSFLVRVILPSGLGIGFRSGWLKMISEGDALVSGSIRFLYMSIALWKLSVFKDPVSQY